jgi:hypothetical protein
VRAVSQIETRCVALLMSPVQVRQVLGHPRGARLLAGGRAMRLTYPRLSVDVDRTFNFVVSIRTRAPGAHTVDGIAVGSRVGNLERRLDPDQWLCFGNPRAAQTCVRPSLFSVTTYRAVHGRLDSIEVGVTRDLLDALTSFSRPAAAAASSLGLRAGQPTGSTRTV